MAEKIANKNKESFDVKNLILNGGIYLVLLLLLVLIVMKDPSLLLELTVIEVPDKFLHLISDFSNQKISYFLLQLSLPFLPPYKYLAVNFNISS